jgi:formate dehydrogenase iron-sulfur subunit
MGPGEERVADLKERGFENAGLYDPAGVGGTHVMYVLHHADKPALTGLPADPASAPGVVWKGWPSRSAWPDGRRRAGRLFHYMRKGPNEVSEEDEEMGADAGAPRKEPR